MRQFRKMAVGVFAALACICLAIAVSTTESVAQDNAGGLTLTIKAEIDEGAHYLVATVTKDGEPVEGVTVAFEVIYSFGTLSLGEFETYDDGTAAVEDIDRLPADDFGMMDVRVRTTAPEQYAGLEVREKIRRPAPTAKVIALDGEGIFRELCAPCHTVGGGVKVGPDLKDVRHRVPSRDWMMRWVKNPPAMIESDDYAKNLRSHYQIDMVPFGYLGDEAIGRVVDYCINGSNGEKTNPPTEAGKAAFVTNCSACHTIGRGKSVGPDLLGVKARVPSRQWMMDFVKNAPEMIKNDAYAKKLRAGYELDMQPFAHLGDETISEIVDYLLAAPAEPDPLEGADEPAADTQDATESSPWAMLFYVAIALAVVQMFWVVHLRRVVRKQRGLHVG